MSVVEIRKTKTREQGSYYCTLLQLYMYLYSTQGKTQGGYNVGQRTPLQGYRSRTCARVRPCVPFVPCVSRLPPRPQCLFAVRMVSPSLETTPRLIAHARPPWHARTTWLGS
jgi:hypothetical protein